MSLTCSNCGKTNIPIGTNQCPVCHQMLAATTKLPASGGMPGSSTAQPMLTGAKGRRYLLNAALPTLIGSKGCAVLLGDPGIPSQAARITPQGGGFYLEDTGGITRINGRSVNGPTPLKPGDKIQIAATELLYQGPAASPMSSPPLAIVAPPVAKPSIMAAPPQPAAFIPKPPPPPPPATPPLPTGVTLRNWSSNPPVVEGYVELVDGPYRVEKGNMVGKVATSLALSLISTTLSMLPFWMQREVNVWFLRVKDYQNGRIASIVMRGEPGGLPQLGDFIAVWGTLKDGNIIMQSGYSYTTDSLIRIKK
jgi:hypothetical protein